MPPVKELHYLDNLHRTKRRHPPRSNDERDSCFVASIKDLSMRGHIDFDRYGRLFCHKGHLLSGDISPGLLDPQRQGYRKSRRSFSEFEGDISRSRPCCRAGLVAIVHGRPARNDQ